MNAYESGLQKNIPAVLVYAFFQDQILLLERRKEGDFHQGKYTGLGGKIERGESTQQAVVREWEEESGLHLAADRFFPLGVLRFPNFKPHRNEDWSVSVWGVELQLTEKEKIWNENLEGRLHWVDQVSLSELPMWPGDRIFLPHVVRREFFLGSINYHQGEVASYELETLRGAVVKN